MAHGLAAVGGAGGRGGLADFAVRGSIKFDESP
jgi:hypothetical protein